MGDPNMACFAAKTDRYKGEVMAPSFKLWAFTHDPTRNAIEIPHNDAYNFGEGAFTLMAVFTPIEIEGSGTGAKTFVATGNIVSKDAGAGAGGWKLSSHISFSMENSLSFAIHDASGNNLQKVTAALKPKFITNQMYGKILMQRRIQIKSLLTRKRYSTISHT